MRHPDPAQPSDAAPHTAEVSQDMPSEVGQPVRTPGSAQGSPEAAEVVGADILEPYIREYLSEQGQQTRHSLMLVSTLSLFVALTGLIPEKVEFLGIEFTAAQKEWFVLILLAITAYFLAEFVVHFWRVIASAGIAVPKKDRIPEIRREFFRWPVDMRVFVSLFSHVYLGIELILPMMVGALAIILLIWTVL